MKKHRVAWEYVGIVIGLLGVGFFVFLVFDVLLLSIQALNKYLGY